MNYTLTLNPSLDHIIHTDDLSNTGTFHQEDTYFIAGGKGINVSILLHELGIETIPLGFLAGFIGQEIDRQLQQQGIYGQWTWTEGLTRSNVKLVGPDGEREINGYGPLIQSADLSLLKQNWQKASSSDRLIVSGSLAQGITEADFLSLIDSFPGERFIDLSGWPLKKALETKVKLIKPNLAELEQLAGKNLPTLDQQVEFVRSLKVDWCILTLGAQGSVLITQEDILVQKPYSLAVQSTTGAGDSFLAGFVAGLEKGWSLEKSFHFGSTCANATVMTNGLATRKQIERRWADEQGTKLD